MLVMLLEEDSIEEGGLHRREGVYRVWCLSNSSSSSRGW